MCIFTYCIPLPYILLLVKCSVSLEYSKMPEVSFTLIYITVVYQKESKKTVSVNIYNKVYLA